MHFIWQLDSIFVTDNYLIYIQDVSPSPTLNCVNSIFPREWQCIPRMNDCILYYMCEVVYLSDPYLCNYHPPPNCAMLGLMSMGVGMDPDIRIYLSKSRICNVILHRFVCGDLWWGVFDIIIFLFFQAINYVFIIV